MEVHVVAERLERDLALLERVDRLDDVPRHPREFVGRVRVSDERRTGVELVFDAVQPGGDGGRVREVGVHVGARYTRLQSVRLLVADDAEAARAIVVAPR